MQKQENLSDKYADMLELPHHVSATRPGMSMHDRAAQFAPFAALTGHDAAIREMARLTDMQAELDENHIGLLNQKIRMLMEQKDAAPEVVITYFAKDARKTGGKYVEKSGRFKDFDSFRYSVVLEDLTEIPVKQIYDISSKLPDFSDFC